MSTPRWDVVLALVLVAAVTNVAAQTHAEAGVEISLQGLASWQPVDDAYVGSPYLDEGLGGTGPGLAIALTITRRPVALAVEYGWAAIDVTQTGRLVSGTAEGQLRDHLFSFLAGASVWSSADASVVALAGLSVLHGQPRQSGVSIDARGDPAAEEGKGALGFSAGANFVRELSGRIGVVVSGRYSALPRSRRATELGVGPHVFRAGAGIRIRLTQ